MCEIGAKHSAFLALEVFTSLPMTEKDFLELYTQKVVLAEQDLNKDGRLRFHVHPLDELKLVGQLREAREIMKGLIDDSPLMVKASRRRAKEYLQKHTDEEFYGLNKVQAQRGGDND
jgi:hypothetical protein